MAGDGLIEKVSSLLAERGNAVALTGAGISVESDIPAFRGAQGLWEKYDPMEFADIEGFIRRPERSWLMLSELIAICEKASPNAAHYVLAELESKGLLKSVITQNVDGLHQAAGTRKVIEYHGNMDELVCIFCWKSYPTKKHWKNNDISPRCDCGEILKPNIVMFGEPIPRLARESAEEEARNCAALLVIGTSALVSPACEIPRIAKKSGAVVVEINTENTWLTDSLTDIYIQGTASEVLVKLLKLL
ncbi:MAG: NAD-dependent protein deacylase [Syntrophorhabdaceae bacterium]|nr:NAD-dependent protein deacylase [Syntrophorhabdaceae bacterium]